MSHPGDILVFYSKSADRPAGSGAGEEAKKPDAYKELNAVRDWRKVLSPQDATCGSFTYEGKRYKSIAHAVQAARARFAETVQSDINKWSLNSGSQNSSANNPLYSLSKKKEQDWEAHQADVYYAISLAKYTSCEPARHVLLSTKKAQLYLFGGNTKKRCNWLERVRKHLQQDQNNNRPKANSAAAGPSHHRANHNAAGPSTSTHHHPASRQPSAHIDADDILSKLGGLRLGNNERSKLTEQIHNGKIKTTWEARKHLRQYEKDEMEAENAAVQRSVKDARKTALDIKHKIQKAKPVHEAERNDAEIEQRVKNYLCTRIAEAVVRDHNLPTNANRAGSVNRVCDELTHAVLNLGLSRRDTMAKVMSIGANLTKPEVAKEASLVSRLIAKQVSAREVVAASTSRDYYPSINASHLARKDEIEAGVNPEVLAQKLEYTRSEESEIDIWERSDEFAHLMDTIHDFIHRLPGAFKTDEDADELDMYLSLTMRDMIAKFVVLVHRQARYSRLHLLEKLKDKTTKVIDYLKGGTIGANPAWLALVIGEVTCAQVVYNSSKFVSKIPK